MNKSKQQLHDEGQVAATIVDDEIFNTIVEEVKQDLFHDWMRTEDRDERETLHNIAAALEVVLTKLRAKADHLIYTRNTQ
jgi:intergrase/recombinase